MHGRQYMTCPCPAVHAHNCSLPRFIYEVIYCADLPWVYGGEYTEFARLVEQVVRAWIEVGLELHFVFDGEFSSSRATSSLFPLPRRTVGLMGTGAQESPRDAWSKSAATSLRNRPYTAPGICILLAAAHSHPESVAGQGVQSVRIAAVSCLHEEASCYPGWSPLSAGMNARQTGVGSSKRLVELTMTKQRSPRFFTQQQLDQRLIYDVSIRRPLPSTQVPNAHLAHHSDSHPIWSPLLPHLRHRPRNTPFPTRNRYAASTCV